MSRPLAVLVAALSCTLGCVLDFDELRARLNARDGDVGGDIGFDAAVTDLPGAPDLPVPPVDVPAMDAGVDAAPPTDLGDPRCTPPINSTIRVAHMASSFGAVDLCMRRAGFDLPYEPVLVGPWPAAGIGYAMVSRPFALNSTVTASNDRWQFAVVPHGTGCSETPIASLYVTLAPQSLSTLVFRSQQLSGGAYFGVLSLINDQVCTDCPAGAIDVRAVHASLDAVGVPINVSINFRVPPLSESNYVNLVFASGVSYGGTSPMGGAGYDCDSTWRMAAALQPDYTVQFGTQAVSGDFLAISERVNLKAGLLLESRMATVFFIGGDGVRTPEPEFVLCYEGIQDAGMTACDRIAATAVAPPSDDGGVAPDDATSQDADGIDGGPDDDVLL